MYNFHMLCLFLWITSILTLPISGEVKTDDNNDSARLALKNATSDNRNSQIMEQTNKSSAKNVSTTSIAGEGGLISITSPAGETSTASYLSNAATDLAIQDASLLKNDIFNANKSKKPLKIVSRKGANGIFQGENNSNISAEVVTFNKTKGIDTPASKIKNINGNKQNDVLKLNATNQENSGRVNNVVQAGNMSQMKLSTNTPMQEHKPKPTATVLEPNSDRHEYIPHSKGPHLGMPKKIDYVLPVIIMLIALPLLGAVVFVIYKQGRDCWEKRHYRRMDFLIDGMYND